MSFLQYKVKFLAGFKDGNILDGRFFAPNEIAVLSETDLTKVGNSGGEVEVLETLVPNPRKVVEPVEAEPKKVSGRKHGG